MSRVPLVLLAFVYAGIMLYGSLVPFQFQPLPADVWLQQLQSLLTSPVNIGSRSDFLANILLMLPFSFLSLGLFIHTTRSKAWWGVPLTLLLCISFSVLLEGLQLLFPPRHASLGDILAQTLGAILGIGLWLLAGVTLLKQYQQLQIPARTRHPLWYLFPLYLLLVVLETAPFDFTLSPVEIVHKYREGKITWVPLQNLFDPDRQLWLKSFWVMVKLLPVGLFLGLLPQLRGVQAVLLGLALATAIELLQLGVLSRYFEPTDILTGTLAVALGFRISTVLRSSPRGEPGTPGLVRSLLFLLLAAMLLVQWWPFQFDFSSTGNHSIYLVPFADYQQKHYLSALDDLAHKFILFTLLAMLLAREPLLQQSLWAVVLVNTCLAAIIEVGQLWLPERYASISDVLLACLAGILGYTLCQGMVLTAPLPWQVPQASQA